jgi:hypothetical protein
LLDQLGYEIRATYGTGVCLLSPCQQCLLCVPDRLLAIEVKTPTYMGSNIIFILLPLFFSSYNNRHPPEIVNAALLFDTQLEMTKTTEL